MAQTIELGDELRTRKVELVLGQLENLPTLPVIAVRLLSLTGQSNSKIQEIVALISADSVLTSKVLRLVSSGAMRVRQPVTTVQQAVVMLGFETIRNLVLSLSVFEIFRNDPDDVPPDGSHLGFARSEFWKHSLAVGTAAEMLAAKCPRRVSAPDAFVCGLLHDLGKVALDAIMPKSFHQAVELAALTRGDISDAERRIIGLDHAVAGKRLAEAWNLPPLITQAIWLHGSAPMTIPNGIVSPDIVRLVGLADLLARRQHIGFSGNYLFPFEIRQYQQSLQLRDEDIAIVTDALAETLEIRAAALGLNDVESRQLYLESIANANTELGRVNQTLAAQNQRLAQRSECFEILTRFYQRIGPAASPAQLLAEIGHVAHGILDAGRLVLFSQDPSQRIGEVLTFDAQQTAQDSFLMPMPPAGGDQRAPRPGSDFVRPASPQVDWLLDRVADFLGAGKCWFMPLLCGQEPVGGIVWVGPEQTPSVAAMPDLALVSASWGMTLRMAQGREQQNVLTEALTASNRELAGLQQQLVRAKSLAGLGEMAAGAAHEMNNPLAVMCGRAQLLAGKLSDVGLRQDATLIAQQGQRLSQIITDLMDFARPPAPQLAECSMVELVEQAVADATQRAGLIESALVRVETSGSVPRIQVDARQVRAAVAEIVLNAIQASRSSGVPTHATESVRTAEVLAQVRYEPLDRGVIVQIIDRGIGMNDETIRHAFSPFYSSKTAGRQRGMGLAKALRWIEGHGGTIRLDSLLGAGTTVVVILPVQNAQSGSPQV